MTTTRDGDLDQQGKGLSPSKRKLPSKDATPTRVHSQVPYQSGGNLFRSKENRLNELSTPSKRQKLGRSDLDPSTAAVDTMYNFPSKTKFNTVIDLTNGSSNSSPKQYSPSLKPTGFAPHTGAKKLVVKNIRTTPRIQPSEYYEKVWSQLDAALLEIFFDGTPKSSLEELYKGAENLCRQGKAPELYLKLQEKCQLHVTDKIKTSLSSRASTVGSVDLLRDFVSEWLRWEKQLITVRSIFFYMDQSYLLRSTEHPSINDMAFLQFRKAIFGDKGLASKILDGVAELITEEREHSQLSINSDILQQSIHTFHSLGVYSSIFELSFSKLSSAYFKGWADKQTSGGDLAEYGLRSTGFIEREIGRCDRYAFDRSTKKILSEHIDEFIVRQHLDFLTDQDSLLNLFEDNDVDSLRHVYNLLQRIWKGSEITTAYASFIVDEGSSIVFDEKRGPEMVVRLLDLKQKLDTMLKSSFGRDEALANTLHKSFEHFINLTKKTASNWGTDNPKPGEMIAKHVDALLRGGVKAIPTLTPASLKTDGGKAEDGDEDETMADEDAEINKQLDLVLDLFRFVHGKAVFEAFYKKDLARRLLMGRSASNDAEKSMLTRLKNECGAGFTHNLESMFKDMDLAREENASYNSLIMGRGYKTGPDLNVNVLSSAAWPTYPDVAVNLPSSITKLQHGFEQHYKAKYNGRKLTWKNALAHCQLRARFPKGNKEIVVSGFQAIVLLQFNDLADGESLSYPDLQVATGLSDAELSRTLQSLACAKYRVLQKHPKGRDVNSTDTFTYNTSFADPKMRIKINQIQLKETKEENKETHERVAADRHYETQAAIVRIMKSRKTIRHAELVAEVIKATKSRGVLDPADIKKNIEKLIEKDYMDREEGGMYTYVA